MTNRWVGVTIDCVDVQRMADFWSALLDRPQGRPNPAGSTSAIAAIRNRAWSSNP